MSLEGTDGVNSKFGGWQYLFVTMMLTILGCNSLNEMFFFCMKLISDRKSHGTNCLHQHSHYSLKITT